MTLEKKCPEENVRFFGGSVLVFAGISIDGSPDFHVFRDGAVTCHRYCYDTLKYIVVPYAAASGNNFLIMDDNALCYVCA